jgi:DNA polymerase-3 subunit delta
MSISNIRLFFGADQFGCMREVNRWKRAFVDKYGDFDMEVIDGRKLSARDILSRCDTLPFMGEKRLLIVRDFLPEAGKKSTSDAQDDDSGDDGLESDNNVASKDDIDTLIAYFEHIPDTAVLLFVSALPDKRTKLFKWFDKSKCITEFPEVRGVSFLQWLKRELSLLSLTFEPDALEYFRLHTGEDLWKAAMELEKLSLYTTGPVSRVDIDMVVSSNVQVKIFAFVDALGECALNRALELFRGLLDRGESIYMVFNMIIRQFRLILQTRFLLDQGCDRSQFASRLRLAPFQVQPLMKQSQNFTFPQLKNIYRQLLELDTALKTGKVSVTAERQDSFVILLEKFFVTCGIK